MTELLSFDENGLQFAWDATSISNYTKCPRYYYYTNIEGWKPNRPSVHLWFGGEYATALEHFYKYLADGADFEEAQHRIVAEALEATWTRAQIGGENRGGPITYETGSKTRENLIRSIIWYTEFFKEDPMPVVKLSDGRPAVELSFSLPVDNDIIFCGHLDRLVEYGGYVYDMDQKTTEKTITSQYFQQFDTSIQMSMYTFAGKAILDSPVKGVVIDAAQVAVGFTRFQRGFTTRTNGQLEEWYDETLETIEKARKATRENHFPRNLTACYLCDFKSVCGSDSRIRPNLLKGDFKQEKRWDPLERR